jgi:hypothetical protein
MLRRSLAFLFFLAGLAGGARAEDTLSAPALNWVHPLFTKEGYRSMTMRGTEVRPVGTGRIDVVDMNITVFTGGAAAKVESVLLSPAASFFPEEKIARGKSSVRLLRDDLEVAGEDWVYDHAAKKVSIARHARITFAAQLPDLIK